MKRHLSCQWFVLLCVGNKMNLTDIAKILFFTSIIIWILPPFKQYKGRYFYFFAIFAIIDPINLIFPFIFKLNSPPQITIFLLYAALLSLIDFKYLKANWIWVLIFTIVLFFPTIFKFDSTKIVLTYVFLEAAITLIVLKNLITLFVAKEKLSLFHTIFLIYQLTIIVKFSNLLIGFADALAFFILTSIAQIFFGLYFSIFREDKPGVSV